METLYFEKPQELRKNIRQLQQKLGIKIILMGKKASIEGDLMDEYEAMKVLEAIQFGFSARVALNLLREDVIFRKIPIRPFTRRKNMEEVRGRVIGKEGKAKRTLEQISGCDILINERENQIGIVGSADDAEAATIALVNLIRGSKHANVYHYLEQSSAQRKRRLSDLGLKRKKES